MKPSELHLRHDESEPGPTARLDRALERPARLRLVALQDGVHGEQKGAGVIRARRSIHLFSGLTKCQTCHGGFTVSSRDTLRCHNNVARGTCTNRRTIGRRELEDRVLRALQTRFFQGGAFDAFCQAFVSEINRLRRERRARLAAAPRALATINRRSEEILELLLNGFRDEAWKTDLQRIERRRAELEATIASDEAEPALPTLHPHMATVFQQKVEQLGEALQQDDPLLRESAREALRGFIDRIEIPSEPAALLIVRGNLGTMLAVANGREGSAAAAVVQLVQVAYDGCGGAQPPLSAALALGRLRAPVGLAMTIPSD